MEIINRRQRMFSIARKLRRENKTVAFVPTMGALHEGHLALVREARQAADVVIVSIFVNPEQFNDRGDLERYPRDLTGDAALLAQYEVDYVFAPELTEIYPEGFSTYVYVEGISEGLEGASRPGHFRGVATVVTILFNTVRPDMAFFGQKDAQQIAVVKRLTTDLGFETEIVVVPTVREESGLAMSSRNRNLTDEEREKAAVIYRGLKEAKLACRNGIRNASELIAIVKKMIEEEPLARIDYIAATDAATLEPIEKIGDSEVVLSAAVFFGKIRLIDNVILNRKQ
ncbi:MAG: pantoate--beta-alanine ligase [Pyrinomonadaceae bacterium]|nr:pantoate--beta-alanine ligase [Blastocatellia bacterium]MCW5955911.1 pantoate--beta-alanine ligase [Pyrinomonadaceae bacterium]